MTSMMAVDRGMMMGTGMPAGMGMPTMPQTTPATPGMMMVPRCTMTCEKVKGGMKLTCSCDDDVACATLQNLCRMMAGGMCSFVCLMNGMPMMQCNMCCCNCKCEFTADGCTFTCATGDKACCDMLQACCDALQACMDAGCCCCVCLGGMPVCCSTC